MQIPYIFCLLWSVLVLAAATEENKAPVNGFQCPTCQNLTSDTCTDKMESCHGEENFCLNSSGTMKKGDSGDSTFVTKGCITELVLSALLGTEKVDSGTTYSIKNVSFEAASNALKPPTPPPKETPAANKEPNQTTGSSPHISSSLCFALWLPSMTWLLLMTLLS